MRTPDDLYPGDTVIIYRGRGVNRTRHAVMVERVTSTMIVADGIRFNKETCRATGGRRETFDIPTEEDLRQIEEDSERRALVDFLQRVEWRDRPLEELRRVVKQVEQ